MKKLPVSAYFSAYNLDLFDIPYHRGIWSASRIFDEVVVAVNAPISNDASLRATKDILLKFADVCAIDNIKLIETRYDYSDIRFDGAIKQAANLACRNELRFQMDLDEFIPASTYSWWNMLDIDMFLRNSGAKVVPYIVLNVYGSLETAKKEPLGVKFRLHKKDVIRGVMKKAVLPNGKIDTSISDTTEPIDENGDLVSIGWMYPPYIPWQQSYEILQKRIPYVVHTGYENLQARAYLNKNFWKKAWEDRSGHEEKVLTSVTDLSVADLFYHGLPVDSDLQTSLLK